MGSPDQRWWTANSTDRPMLDFYSSETTYFSMSWVNVFTGESISASGVTAFATWFLPAGFSAIGSGTAAGSSAHWVRVSATGAIGSSGRASARVLSTSGRQLFESFDMRIFSGA